METNAYLAGAGTGVVFLYIKYKFKIAAAIPTHLDKTQETLSYTKYIVQSAVGGTAAICATSMCVDMIMNSKNLKQAYEDNAGVNPVKIYNDSIMERNEKKYYKDLCDQEEEKPGSLSEEQKQFIIDFHYKSMDFNKAKLLKKLIKDNYTKNNENDEINKE